MKNMLKEMKSICLKTIAIGGCAAFIMTGSVMADSEAISEVNILQGAGVSSYQTADIATTDAHESVSTVNSGYASDELSHKHREIDDFVFAQHSGEFSEMGFNVTHTGPNGEFIEIGITPYSKERAEWLYDMFGQELVRVVEGEQAILYDIVPASEPALGLDTPTSDSIAEVNATTVSTTDADLSAESDEMFQTIAYEEPASSGISNVWITVSIVLLVIILGGGMYLIRKQKTTS